MTIVDFAIEKAGSLKNLARKYGVTPQSVHAWKRKGYFPLEQIHKIVRDFPEISDKDCIDAYRNFEEKR